MDSPPVPPPLTVTGFSSGSLEGMSKVSFAAPDTAGANRTVRVQLADGARVLPEQPSVPDGMLNGAASGFADATVPITRLAVPFFVTVPVWSEEAPTVTLPRGTWRSVSGATESVTVTSGRGAPAPVPLTLTVTGVLSGSLEGVSKGSFAAPDAVGANRTVRVQLADGARVMPEQPSVADGMLNGAASGFADATVPITRLAVPAFVTVTVWLEEAPTMTLT